MSYYASKEEFKDAWTDWAHQADRLFYHAGITVDGLREFHEEMRDLIDKAADNLESYGGFQ